MTNKKNKVMEANAPEKIFLQENTTTDCYEEWWPEWFGASAKDSDIEYTRTDVFVEKACDAYCKICDTKECEGLGECVWLNKFREVIKKQ